MEIVDADVLRIASFRFISYDYDISIAILIIFNGYRNPERWCWGGGGFLITANTEPNYLYFKQQAHWLLNQQRPISSHHAVMMSSFTDCIKNQRHLKFHD